MVEFGFIFINCNINRQSLVWLPVFIAWNGLLRPLPNAGNFAKNISVLLAKLSHSTSFLRAFDLCAKRALTLCDFILHQAPWLESKSIDFQVFRSTFQAPIDRIFGVML
jgi:hypothetical protein